MAERLSKWLETWRKNPDQPLEFSQQFWRRKGWVKTGGGSRQPKGIARGTACGSGPVQTPVLWLGPPDPFTLRCCECERALGTRLLQPCAGSDAGEPRCCQRDHLVCTGCSWKITGAPDQWICRSCPDFGKASSLGHKGGYYRSPPVCGERCAVCLRVCAEDAHVRWFGVQMDAGLMEAHLLKCTHSHDCPGPPSSWKNSHQE